jgi:hypothetical protein
MAARAGFEPTMPESRSGVLPVTPSRYLFLWLVVPGGGLEPPEFIRTPDLQSGPLPCTG